MLVVGTYRDVEVGPEHPLFETLGELARESIARRLVLRGFDASDVAQYVEGTTGAVPSTAVVDAVLGQTDGNPFFVGEVVRLLIAEGGAEHFGRETIGALRVPAQVREVIARRLARLSTDCNDVLQVASVIGRDFDLGLLARAVDQSRERLLGVLEEAGAARLIAATPDSLAGYRFAHALVRETLYDALPGTRRVALHRRIAEAMEGLYGTDAKGQLAALAHHRFETARGGENVAEAVAASRRAGERADGMLAFEEAVRHYDRALHALDLGPERDDDRQRLALLYAAGVAGRKASIPSERKITMLERAVELAERVGEVDLQAAAALQYHLAVHDSPLVGSGLQLPALEEALAALGPTPGAIGARLLAAMVMAYARTAARDHLAEARRAREIADRTGELEARVAALEAVHAALLGPDRTEERLAVGVELLALAEVLGEGNRETFGPLQCRVLDLCEIGDMPALDAVIDRACIVIDRACESFLAGKKPLWHCMRAANQGRYHDAERFLFELFSFASQSGNRWVQATAGGLFYDIRLAQGRVAEVDAGVLVQQLPDDAPERAMRQAFIALHHLEMERVDEARSLFDALAVGDFPGITLGWHFMMAMALAATVAHRLKDGSRAAVLYDRLLPYAHLNISGGYGSICQGSASMPLGMLATTLGRFDAAERHFEDAIAFDRRTGARPWLARGQYAYAEMLEVRGRSEDVGKLDDLLGEALATFEYLGMPKDVERALAMRHRVGAANPPSAVGDATVRRSADGGLLRHEGEYWTVSHGGTVCRLRDTPGIRYLAHLLRHPGREFHVLDLVHAVAGRSGSTDAGATPQGAAGPVLDAQAKAAYRRRLTDLRDELAEAEQFHDVGRIARAREEIELLTEQLAAGVGLGGRDRVVGADAERARSTVTHGIRSAVKRITERVPLLGHELRRSLRTGTFCSYTPEPSHALRCEL